MPEASGGALSHDSSVEIWARAPMGNLQATKYRVIVEALNCMVRSGLICRCMPPPIRQGGFAYRVKAHLVMCCDHIKNLKAEKGLSLSDCVVVDLAWSVVTFG